MSKSQRTLGPDGFARQYAALPFRETSEGIEILLLSSRETRRWVIPKGWPIRKLSPAATAAREAYEEAGLKGQVGDSPIGTYPYDKRLEDGSTIAVRVTVFSLEVAKQAHKWPELGQREFRWCRPEEAATLVMEPELSALLRSFQARVPHG